MNIFVLDFDPQKAAMYHNDKHVVKMIVETAQLLCSVHHMTSDKTDIPYKLISKNHPCAKWARKSRENYLWLLELGLYLCKEYEHRYGKVHKSLSCLAWCVSNRPNLPSLGITSFALAMPEEHMTDNAIFSYRLYYLKDKNHLANWTKREKPDWYIIE